MAWKINRDLFRYDDVCASGVVAAMVFSNTDDGRAVLKTPEIMTRDDPVCLGARGINDAHRQPAQLAYLPIPGLAEGPKSSSELV